MGLVQMVSETRVFSVGKHVCFPEPGHQVRLFLEVSRSSPPSLEKCSIMMELVASCFNCLHSVKQLATSCFHSGLGKHMCLPKPHVFSQPFE